MPFPSPVGVPNPGIKPAPPHWQAVCLQLSHQGGDGSGIKGGGRQSICVESDAAFRCDIEEER